VLCCLIRCIIIANAFLIIVVISRELIITRAAPSLWGIYGAFSSLEYSFRESSFDVALDLSHQFVEWKKKCEKRSNLSRSRFPLRFLFGSKMTTMVERVMCCVAAAVWRLMWVRRSEIFGKALSGITTTTTTTVYYLAHFMMCFSFLAFFGAFTAAAAVVHRPWQERREKRCMVISLTTISGRTVININGYKLTIPRQ
jgi:hypothetical protein